MAETIATEKILAAPRERSNHSYLAYGRLWTVFTYAILILGTVISLGPFVWMIMKSFMSLGESIGATFIPTNWHPENYATAWRDAQFSKYLVNSVLITLITLAGELTFSVMAAYAFARIKFPGRNALFALLLSSMMIPGMVTMIPNLLTVTWLGRVGPFPWIDNWPALTIPFMGSVFSLFLLRQFFIQIPEELFDAAKMDGAGHLRMLWQIVLPLAKAPVMVIIVLSFIGTWNALAWPLLVTNTPDWLPISVGLYDFVQDAGSEINLVMAGSVITIVPILVLYFLTQKQFTESIARSGMKG